MANTYSNSVVIAAPLEIVEHYLVDISIDDYRFNMAKLFPEQFPATDKSGDETWTSEWTCDTTGFPTVGEVEVTDR